MMKPDLFEAYKSMYLLRQAEEAIARYYFENKIFSFVHFYIGQEAVAVGVSQNLGREDRAFGNHRSHGHYLAKGGNLGGMYAEMLGKEGGCCNGKGGSMHMLDRSVGFMGTTPILGSILPIATGSALQQRMKESKNITVVYVGDGAAEEGVFYESLNLGGLYRLPLLVVLENNLYSVNTPAEDRKSEGFDYGLVCKGLGVNYLKANGNDFLDVFQKTAEAIKIMNETGKPCVLECTVFRHMAHSAPITDDHLGYRKIDTLENRVSNDSVFTLRALTVTNRGEDLVQRLEVSIDLQVQIALEFAINSPLPNSDELYKGVFH